MSVTNDYTITITTTQIVSGATVYVPRTNLSPVLKAQPWETVTHSGTHLGNGSYLFQNVDDGLYKLYESSDGDEIQSWGGANGKWIGDTKLDDYAMIGEPNTFLNTNIFSKDVQVANVSTTAGAEKITVNSQVSIPNNQTGYSLICYGKANFDSEININQKDIKYVNNLQTKSISEANTGEGISIDSPTTFTQGLTATNIPRLDVMNTFLKKNTFNGMTINGPNYFEVNTPTSFVNYAPLSPQSPQFPTSLTNKSYVDEKVNSISWGLSAAYQQSTNVIRFLPNGVEEPGRLFNTWHSAMVYANNQYPTSNKQFTIEIEGLGNNNTYIQMVVHDPQTYNFAYIDFVHLKGIGSNIVVKSAQAADMISMSATTLGNIVVENLTIRPYAADYSTQWINIVFRNCLFVSEYDLGQGLWSTDNFVGCEFFNCLFVGGDNNSWVFDCCTGNRIFTEQIPVVSGINRIQYSTPKQIAIGTKIIKDNNSELELSNLKVNNNLYSPNLIIGDAMLTANSSSFVMNRGLNVSTGLTANVIKATSKFITSQNIPASSDSDGEAGQIAVDYNYIYICRSTNNWVRQNLEGWELTW